MEHAPSGEGVPGGCHGRDRQRVQPQHSDPAADLQPCRPGPHAAFGVGPAPVDANSRITQPSLLDNPPICHVADTDGGPADPAGPPPHIRFAYNATGICTAAVPVALKRGFFHNHNLDVEFVQLAGSTDQMITALATSHADAGVGMELTWLKPLEQGLDVRLTTALHGGCTRMLARKDGGPKDIAELRGKTIGVSSISGTPRNFFAVLLSDAGINPDSDVQWRGISSRPARPRGHQGRGRRHRRCRSGDLDDSRTQQRRARRDRLQPERRLCQSSLLRAGHSWRAVTGKSRHGSPP